MTVEFVPTATLAMALDREVVEVAARIDWQCGLDVRRRIGKLPSRNAVDYSHAAV